MKAAVLVLAVILCGQGCMGAPTGSFGNVPLDQIVSLAVEAAVSTLQASTKGPLQKRSLDTQPLDAAVGESPAASAQEAPEAISAELADNANSDGDNDGEVANLADNDDAVLPAELEPSAEASVRSAVPTSSPIRRSFTKPRRRVRKWKWWACQRCRLYRSQWHGFGRPFFKPMRSRSWWWPRPIHRRVFPYAY
ncbi:hypothetical protein H4R34_006450 [Dimargaris verticillata]|uniref:Uncharacterized protein n=1 Tax=Dimargaris verticillata TaxID=2761393 RepID=A0A9W8E7F7_9FUNG|nr:hypothetical protein H4R34_006450 [Dimargaris verticillata]